MFRGLSDFLGHHLSDYCRTSDFGDAGTQRSLIFLWGRQQNIETQKSRRVAKCRRWSELDFLPSRGAKMAPGVHRPLVPSWSGPESNADAYSLPESFCLRLSMAAFSSTRQAASHSILSRSPAMAMTASMADFTPSSPPYFLM